MSTNEKPSFKAIIDDVVAFYKNFDDKFSDIDTNFDTIDENGGYHWESIKSVIRKLQVYHAANDAKLSKEQSATFSQIIKRLNRKITLDELHGIIKTVQTEIHDILTHDIKWAGQQQCTKIINLALSFLSDLDEPTDKFEKDTLYSVVSMLRELIADTALAINGLIPLANWSYGTEQYALLTAEQQLIILLNQAIITDRMYLSIKSLETILNRVNKLLDSFNKLNWLVYYDVGFLNFKIHQYPQARKYFEIVKQQISLKNGNEEEKKKYFHAELLIAYSYEYSGDFINAITVLATSPDCIAEYLLSQDETNVSFNHIISGFLNTIRDNDSLLATYFNLKSAFIDGDSATSTQAVLDSLLKNKTEVQYDMQIEILHALAHCLNEYAVKLRTDEDNDDGISKMKVSSKITRFSRSLMQFVAEKEPEYWTCFATIHGEQRDYHQALQELEIAKTKILDKYHNCGKSTLLAEISFFRYYFNQMIGISAESDKNDFEEYCKKFSDEDAECHIRIFEFKNEIKKYFEQLFFDLAKFLENNECQQNSICIREPSEYLQNAYRKLCCLQPTLYMNANVRAELRLMQRAYICLIRLREYALNLGAQQINDYSLIGLLNACRRFISVRTELETFSDKSFVDKSGFLDLKTVFFESARSLSHCLHNSDSIFILAPISGVVVYQYQTGTINQLFNEDNINPEILSLDRDSWNNFVSAFFADRQNYPGQPKIIELNWNNNFANIDEVYYWDEVFPSRLIVADKNGTVVRQIVDVDAFKATISNLAKDTSRNVKYCIVGKNSGTCPVRSAKIGWLEVINETDKEISCLIFWKGKDMDDNLRCFIVCGENIDRHNYHEWVKRADIVMVVPEIEEGSNPIEDEKPNRSNYTYQATLAYNKKHAELLNQMEVEKRQMENFGDKENATCIRHQKKYDEIMAKLTRLELYWKTVASRLETCTILEIEQIIQNIDRENFVNE